MRTEIEKLIQQHKQAKEEVWGCLNELSQLDEGKMSKEEKDALRTTIFCLENEHSLYLSFISDLENLLF